MYNGPFVGYEPGPLNSPVAAQVKRSTGKLCSADIPVCCFAGFPTCRASVHTQTPEPDKRQPTGMSAIQQTRMSALRWATCPQVVSQIIKAPRGFGRCLLRHHHVDGLVFLVRAVLFRLDRFDGDGRFEGGGLVIGDL